MPPAPPPTDGAAPRERLAERTFRCTGPAAPRTLTPRRGERGSRHGIELGGLRRARVVVGDRGDARSGFEADGGTEQPGCRVVWFAPTPRSSGGRSAVSSRRGFTPA